MLKSCPLGQFWPRPRGQLFNIELYSKTFKNLPDLEQFGQLNSTSKECSLLGTLQYL